MSLVRLILAGLAGYVVGVFAAQVHAHRAFDTEREHWDEVSRQQDERHGIDTDWLGEWPPFTTNHIPTEAVH